MGMRVFHVADLAYVTARRQSYAHIARLLPAYAVIAAAMEMQATQYLSIFYLVESDLLSDLSRLIDQAHMLQNMYAAVHEDLIHGSTFAQQARIRAVAAPGRELGSMPPPRPLEIWYSLMLHFRILSVCDWECRSLVRARDMIIVVRH